MSRLTLRRLHAAHALSATRAGHALSTLTPLALSATHSALVRSTRAALALAPSLAAHALSATLAVLALGATHAAAQDPGWNDPLVLSLIDRARTLRQSVTVDPDLTSYKASARGHVYFYVDRPDSAEHVLIKGDQVALDVYWRAPNTTKQWIVGLRDEKVLPTSIRYHLDHLTVVQDDFGDFIRLGDGDEVEEVVHPVAPHSEDVYDFFLSDSLTLSYAGGAERIRVWEVRVRPKRFDRPGFVGTVFLDRDRAAIVRMNFSFTPASYVDPYLDYIRISLDNSLWLGEYWLPYRQESEIRREMPVLDVQAGSTIRSRFEIRDYDFNVEIPTALLAGPSVRAVSPAQQQAFPFEEGIFADLEEEGGLRESPTMTEVRTQVREVVEDEVMSGLSPIRLHFAQLSDFARYDRAEGLFLGAGVTLRPHADLRVRATGGYAIARARPSGALALTSESDAFRPSLDAYWDAMGDIGGHPGATRLENTISSVSGEEDFLDPYFRRGATVTFSRGPASRIAISLRGERHLGARDVVSDGPDSKFRPVRSIDEGTLAALVVTTRAGLPGGGSASLIATGGRLFAAEPAPGAAGTTRDAPLASLAADASWTLDGPADGWTTFLSAAGGVANPDAPAQSFFLIGGRHTLPGHDYRAFAGNVYWLTRAELTIPVRPPYVGIRAFGAAGATTYLGDVDLPADWSLDGSGTVRDSNGVRGSVGLGLSIGWDAMRFDVGRAVWGGGWEAVFSMAPQFRSWL